MVVMLPGLFGQNRRLVIGRGLPLLKGDGPGGTGGQTVTQTVAVVLPGQPGLAVHQFDGPFMTCGYAGPAAVAGRRINVYNFTDHLPLPP